MRTKVLEDFLEIRGNQQLREGKAFRDSYALLGVIFDQAFQLMGLLDPDGTLIRINRTASRSIGGKEFEVIGKPFWETPWWTHIPAQQRRLREAIRAAAGGKFIRFDVTHRVNDKIVYVDFSLKPVRDQRGNVVLLVAEGRDITERKLAEEKNLRLAAVVECSDDAVIGKTADGIITSWNRGAEKIFGYSEDEVLGRHVTMLVPPENHERVLHVQERVKLGDHIEHFENVSRRKDGTLIDMSLTYSPIRDPQGKVIAISTIGRDITEQKKAAAILVDNAKIKRELEIAKEIQQSLLPICPRELPGLFTACRCVPATHVGGDYYDFFSLEAGIVDVVIADVTGHSVGSALLMAMTRSVLHAKVSAGRSPGKLLAAVNDLLYDDLSRAELQISMFYARLDTGSRTLAYASAGHNPPFLFSSRESQFRALDADGLLLGIKKKVFFEEIVTPLEAGDILILYTDGVTEAENAQGEPFGAGRLCEVIAERCAGHPQEIMAAIFSELTAFAGPKPLLDDVAMTIYKMA